MPVNSTAWTTLANAKEWLQITDSSQDALITNLINRSQVILETYLGRQIKQATYTEHHDGDGTNAILVDVLPIISVTSVHSDSTRTFGSDTLVAAADYVIDKTIGQIRLFKTTSGLVSNFPTGIQNVKVVYEGGYASIPLDLEQIACQHIAWMKNRQNTEGFTSASFGGKSETYDPSYLPPYIKDLLRSYKKITC